MKGKLLEIINHYGVMPQLKYLQSEVFEFNEAVIFNYNDEYCGCRENIEHIAEELADVMVMLKQFQCKYRISDELIESIMEQKIDRQLGRITNEK